MILSFPVSHVSLNASSQPMLGQEKAKASPGDTQTCESPLNTKHRSSLFKVRLLQVKEGCGFSPHFHLFFFVSLLYSVIFLQISVQLATARKMGSFYQQLLRLSTPQPGKIHLLSGQFNGVNISAVSS